MACLSKSQAYGNYRTTCFEYPGTGGAYGRLAGIHRRFLVVRDL